MKTKLYIGSIFLILLAIAFFITRPEPPIEAFNRDQYPFKVLLILPHNIDDGSWNQLGYEALIKIGTEENINVDYRQNVSSDSLAAIIDEYSTEESLFVIALGGEFTASLEPVARKYPQIKFAVVGRYAGNGRNYGSISTGNGNCYLAGVLAAMKSTSGHIGAVMGIDHAHIKAQYQAFWEGATTINKDIRCTVRYTGSWDDQPTALKHARDLYEAGVDVLLVNHDQISAHIHRYADDNGIQSISMTTDERSKYPNTVIAALMTDMHKQLSTAVKIFLKGQWEGKLYRFGMAEGVTYIDLKEGVLNEEQSQIFERIQALAIQRQIKISDILD